VGSLIDQTHAAEVVAMVEVKNCGRSERSDVKTCKGEGKRAFTTDEH
jgi:hypothetical protein